MSVKDCENELRMMHNEIATSWIHQIFDRRVERPILHQISRTIASYEVGDAMMQLRSTFHCCCYCDLTSTSTSEDSHSEVLLLYAIVDQSTGVQS